MLQELVTHVGLHISRTGRDMHLIGVASIEAVHHGLPIVKAKLHHTHRPTFQNSQTWEDVSEV